MERATTRIYTISEVTQRIKGLLETEIGTLWVSGEISNYVRATSGHAYFTLKDANSQLAAVIFKGRLNYVKFVPENGLEVLVRGKLTAYEKRGTYQILIEEMHPKGLGALQLAYEKLKQKLAEEGLFDEKHKKKIPLLPRRIGVVTSPTGAAIQDILNIINRRFANVHVLLYPARVQGTGSVEQIVQGIRSLDQWGVDVIIVGRGGGSLEDLWSFNEEPVVRAIFAATTPIISAVGHEIDYSLSDFVADLRAPTPSAAAELVVQERAALVDQLRQYKNRLKMGLGHHFSRLKTHFTTLSESWVFTSPEMLFREYRQVLDELRLNFGKTPEIFLLMKKQEIARNARLLSVLSPQKRLGEQTAQFEALKQRLNRDGRLIVDMTRRRFHALPARLHALSPLAVLGRGYALAFKMPEEKLLYSVTQVETGEEVRLWLRSGELITQIKTINEKGGINKYELEKE